MFIVVKPTHSRPVATKEEMDIWYKNLLKRLEESKKNEA